MTYNVHLECTNTCGLFLFGIKIELHQYQPCLSFCRLYYGMAFDTRSNKQTARFYVYMTLLQSEKSLDTQASGPIYISTVFSVASIPLQQRFTICIYVVVFVCSVYVFVSPFDRCVSFAHTFLTVFLYCSLFRYQQCDSWQCVYCFQHDIIS